MEVGSLLVVEELGSSLPLLLVEGMREERISAASVASLASPSSSLVGVREGKAAAKDKNLSKDGADETKPTLVRDRGIVLA